MPFSKPQPKIVPPKLQPRPKIVPSKPPVSLPKGLFGKGQYVPNWQLQQYLKKAKGNVPGYAKKFTTKERAGLGKVLREQGAGTLGVEKSKYRMALYQMEKARTWMKCRTNKDFAEKKLLDQKIAYLKNLLKSG